MFTKQRTIDSLTQRLKHLEVIVKNQALEIDRLESELRVSKDQAEENEDIFKLFLKNCPIYVFFKDSQIRIIYLSSNYEKMLGQPVENLVGKSMSDIFPPDLARGMIEDDLRILTKGDIVEIEEEFNGRNYYTIKFPIHRSGKPSYLAGFTMDITDRKLAEQIALQKSNALEEINFTKDKLLSIISHDLRNSFNAILGFSEILQMNSVQLNNPKIEGMVNHINFAAENAYTLLNNLLDWAKSHLNQINVQKSLFDVTELLRVIEFELQTVANKKHISLVSAKRDQLNIFADFNMVSIILRNLISNAIKFSQPNGSIHISVNDMGDSLAFSVADDGVGMDDETKNKLFSSIINESHEGTTNEKGTGLGLVICKEFVEKHGGQIWVESELGKGSIFKFILPKTDSSL